MPQFLTDNISVKVLPKFEKDHSSPVNDEYVFSYHIDILNDSNTTVQLLSRHWYIFDSNGHYAEVKGEGVIGQQPIILPGKVHSYDSYCNLKTDIGMMWGTYLMKEIESGKLFEVAIPEFQMITPMRLN